jgi:hypothetical protein
MVIVWYAWNGGKILLYFIDWSTPGFFIDNQAARYMVSPGLYVKAPRPASSGLAVESWNTETSALATCPWELGGKDLGLDPAVSLLV